MHSPCLKLKIYQACTCIAAFILTVCSIAGKQCDDNGGERPGVASQIHHWQEGCEREEDHTRSTQGMFITSGLFSKPPDLHSMGDIALNRSLPESKCE